MSNGKTMDKLRGWFRPSIALRAEHSAVPGTGSPARELQTAPITTLNRAFQPRLLWISLLLPLVLLASHLRSTRADAPSQQQQIAHAAKIVGPDGDNDNACSKCHTMEFDAWQTTAHFSSFITRQQDPRTRIILDKMGFKSMKRQAECRQCHFTSIMDDGKLVPTWGITCESCHGAAADWVAIHNKIGGDPNAAMLKWGTGKDQPPAQKRARLDAAKSNGMVNSRMIYELAVNCIACHGVPDETLVNKGGHQPGSDFDLVAWSQGEVRHNFADSSGAPDHPTNRPATPAELRRFYIVGCMVDLEFAVRDLAETREKQGEYEKAVIARINHIHSKIASVFALAAIPELAAAVKELPEPVDGATVMPAGLADRMSAATKEFAAKNDGSELAAIDGLIPKAFVGKVFKGGNH
jgi:hypothetical protein